MTAEASPAGATPPRNRRGVRDRVVELVRVPAGELVVNPNNWRRHPERQRAALRGLLKEIGYADALLARRENGSLLLIDGHLRRSLDPAQVVPVLVLDLTASEADKLLATLDPLAGMAEPDPEILARLLGTVKTSSAAVRALLDSVRRQAGLSLVAPKADPEWIPPVPAKPRTRRGDLWALGEHRLLCGDATSPGDLCRLMDGAKADVLWTDPPYGVNYSGKTARALRLVNDEPTGLSELLAAAFSAIDTVLRPGAALYVAHPAGASSVLFGERFLAQGWRLHQTLVWVKDCMVLGHADYHYRHEPILYGYTKGPGRWGRGAKGWHGGNAQTSVIEVARPVASPEHPTAKPVELVSICVRNSSTEGDRILDPFAGSGSTIIASELLGRRAYGLELDPQYCDVVVKRWEAITGQKATRARA